MSAAKFGKAQNGTRSAPPCRWFPGVGDITIDPTRSIHENVNDQAAIVIQIESEVGVKNLDAILTAVGHQIDAVWIGSLDLRVSMGLNSFWGSEPEFLEVIELYQNTLKKHDIPNSGMVINGNWAMGANKAFVIVGGDLFAFLGETANIMSARQNLGPLKNGQKNNVEKVPNGTAH